MNYLVRRKRRDYACAPKTNEELIEIIKQRMKSDGPECDLNDIDVSSISDMSYVFADKETYRFNGSISEWDVSNANNMFCMFANSEFNGNITGWDVSNVQNMQCMFYKSKFNGDISAWNVSNVEFMDSMFYCSDFDGNISEWDVRKVTHHTCEFLESPLENCPEKQPKFN